jgi:prephenate dehydrogenase
LKVAILGVGLIGGSIGLAARERAGAEVCGYDPDAGACEAALELGAIDTRAADIPGAVAGAQAVFAAAPVGVLSEVVLQALAHAPSDCVISDVGSTKLALEHAREDRRFIGGHPLAGAETASRMTDETLYERLSGLVECLGARPTAIAPDAHDRLMASVSHLPHVLANVLVAQAIGAFEREGVPPAAGPSLGDAIRVAGANTAIWTDIYLSNRTALVEAVEEILQRLEEVRDSLTRADSGALAAWNERADAARRSLLR